MPGLFDAVPDALVVVDTSGCIVRANRQAEELFGYPAGGLDGVGVETLVPVSLRERHRQHRATYMAVPRVRPMGAGDMTLVGQRRSGEQFPVEIALSPLPDAASPLFLASIRDVSESQRVRQALARARYDAVVARIGRLALEARDGEPALPAIPRMLSETLELSGVVLAFEDEGRSIEVHAAGTFRPEAALGDVWPTVWSGLTSTVVLGEDEWPSGLGTPPPGSSALIPLLDRQRAIGLLAAVAPCGKSFEHDVLHALQSTATLVAALLQRQRSEAQLAHAQRLDALGQLTGGVAHDFNNLLTVLSGNLQLIEMQAGQDVELAPLIESAMSSAARGADLTAKLLSFARRQQLRPQVVTLGPFLEQFRAMLERTLGPGVETVLRVDVPRLQLVVDASQLEAALLNLALNARDAMPGGGRLDITAEMQWIGAPDGLDVAPGRYAVLSVLDTGAGMGPDVLRRAVDPFFTTKRGGRGSGLGLSMVYGFARQSGGDLRIDSSPGSGTAVRLCLPAQAGAPVAPVVAAPVSRRGTGEMVLTVDDDPAVRTTSVRLLTSLGYCPVAAADAQEALSMLEDQPQIRLVVTDVMLGPGPDGVALAMRIRERWPHIAVLLTTGYPHDASHRSARFPMLAKPYRQEDLARAVAEALSAA